MGGPWARPWAWPWAGPGPDCVSPAGFVFRADPGLDLPPHLHCGAGESPRRSSPVPLRPQPLRGPSMERDGVPGRVRTLSLAVPTGDRHQRCTWDFQSLEGLGSETFFL